MIKITPESYKNLREVSAFVYAEDEGYYLEPNIIPNEHKNLIEECPKYLIYKFLDRPVGGLTPYDKPASIIFPDQLNTNLYKEHKLLYGEKIETIYYAGYNINTDRLSAPVIKITYKYIRDESYLLRYKEREIHWTYENGEWSSNTQKDIIPFLSQAKKLAEIKEVRTNIIDEAESLAKEQGLFDHVRELFEKYLQEITLYKETGSKRFSTSISTDEEHSYWLDKRTPDDLMTIREFLSQFFLIGTKV